MRPLAVELPDEVVEAIAARAAALVTEQVATTSDAGYLDVQAAAAYLSCPVSRIYSLTSAGRIPHHKDGSRTLFTRPELDAYIAAGGAKRP